MDERTRMTVRSGCHPAPHGYNELTAAIARNKVVDRTVSKNVDTMVTGSDEDEASGGDGGTGDQDSSVEDTPDGVNREFAQIEGEFNYSITKRWKDRSDQWGRWQIDVLANGTLHAENVHGLEPPSFKHLSLDINGISPMVQTLQTFREYTESFKVEIANLSSDIESLEEEKVALASERDGFEGQLQSLRGEKIIPLTLDLNEGVAQRIADQIKTSTDYNAELIKTKTELIKKNTELIKKNTDRIIDKTELFKSKSNIVHSFIKDIHEKHIEIRNLFSFIRRIGNESTISQTVSRQSLDHTRVDITAIPSPSKFDLFCPVTTPILIDDLISRVRVEKKPILLEFQKFVMDLLKEATRSHDSTKVKATTAAVLSWNEGSLVERFVPSRYARPPTASDHETKVDQPILHAVICRIIRIIADQGGSTNTNRAVLHEQEHGVTIEQSVAGCANMKARRVDMTAQQRVEYLAAVLPSMIERPIEIKAAPLGETKFRKAVEKGRSQVFGHLGKRVMGAFDYGGAGHESCAVGISLTYLSIEVIMMRLNHVGTPEVELVAISTGCMPLLGKKLMSQGQKAAIASEQPDGDGFLVLAGALMYESLAPLDIGITLVEQGPARREVLQNYLGSGTFSHAYKLEQDQCFLKIPKSASLVRNLEQEASILTKLQVDPVFPFIPKCEGVSMFECKSRGEISLITGLRLSGVVGLPLHRLPRNHWTDYSTVIVESMFKALDFAHKKSIFHLDVRPGNIIVGVAGSECRAMLADWGCAIERGCGQTCLKAFHGSTPYAHDRLLGPPPHAYKIGCELDFASLAYTLDHVCAGELRWIASFVRPRQVSDDDKKRRRDLVSAWLQSNDLRLPQDTIDTFLAACNDEACTNRRSKRRRGNT
jgi:hypothetical protein